MSKDLQSVLKTIYELRKSAYLQIGIEALYKKPFTDVLSSYVRALDFQLDELFSKYLYSKESNNEKTI